MVSASPSGRLRCLLPNFPRVNWCGLSPVPFGGTKGTTWCGPKFSVNRRRSTPSGNGCWERCRRQLEVIECQSPMSRAAAILVDVIRTGRSGNPAFALEEGSKLRIQVELCWLDSQSCGPSFSISTLSASISLGLRSVSGGRTGPASCPTIFAPALTMLTA